MQPHGFTRVGRAAGHGAGVRAQEDPGADPALPPARGSPGSRLNCARAPPWRQVR